MRPGPTNSLIDVAGLRVGHAQRVGDGYLTGVTAVLAPDGGAVGGVDVRGAAPGTRETELLDPRNLVERVHAIVLCGGSAFGLSAASGVMDRLADAGAGFPVDGGAVPIVPGAVIYDLGRGGRFRAVPDAALGAAAYDAALGFAAFGGGAKVVGSAGRAASPASASGSIGAGTGAVAGGFAGGVGTASVMLPAHKNGSQGNGQAQPGITVAALAVANPAGSVLDPGSGLLSGTRYGLPGEFAHVRAPAPEEVAGWQPVRVTSFNTTIGVVATNLTLSKAQCGKLAAVAHDGLARAIRPAHTMVDGDTIFALATSALPAPDDVDLHDVLAAGADVFSRAVAHAVLAATGRPGAPAYLDVFPSAARR